MVLALSIITYALLIAIPALGVIIGFKRGLARSVIRSIYLCVLLPLSYLLGRVAAAKVAELLISKLSGMSGWTGTFINGMPESLDMLEVLACALATPIIFAVLFGILEALSLICFGKISRAAVRKVAGDRAPGRFSAKFGGLIGLVQGLVVSTVLLIPLCMCVTLMSTSSPDALASLKVPGFDGAAGEASDSSPVEMLPSNRILYPMTMIADDELPADYSELRGTELCAMDEAPDLINAAGNAKKAYQASLAENDSRLTAIIRALGAVNAVKGDSRLLPFILTDVMHTTSKTLSLVDEIQALLGMNDDGNIAHQFLTEIFAALEHAKPSNVSSLIETLAGDGFSSATIESMLQLKANTDAGASINDHLDVVADILVSLGEHDELRHINDIVSDTIVDYIAEADTPLTSEDVSDVQKKQLFENVADELQAHVDAVEISENVSYEQKVADVSSAISDATKDYNYELSEDELTIAAVGIISYTASTDEITPEGIMDYLGYSEEDIKRILSAE